MRGVSMLRKSLIARFYAAFFVVASFFVEGTTAAQIVRTRQVPTPSFNFQPVSNATTCQTLNFAWTYEGNDYPVAFYATNIGVPQAPPVTSTATSTRHNTDTNSAGAIRAVPTGVNNPTPYPTLAVLVAFDVLSSKLQYSWSPVNIPQGWYMLYASFSSPEPINFFSSSFFVSNGTNLSCLSPSSPTSTGTSQTSSQATSTGTSVTSSPIIGIPVGGASTSPTNGGLIAGVTIGAVVLVAAALSISLWLYRKRQRTKAGAGSATHIPRLWNGLGSTDSRGGFMGDTSSRRQHPVGSVGTIPMSPSEEAVARAEKHSIHSKFGEGSPFDDDRGVALATLPVLHPRSKSNSGVARTYSLSSSISNGLSPNEFGAAGATTLPSRRPSVPDSLRGRRSEESMGYPPSSPSSGFGVMFIPTPGPGPSRSHSLSTSATHQTSMMGHTAQSTTSHTGLRHSPSPQPEVSSPISPVSPSSIDAVKQANRRSIGGHKRKPVPAYIADDEPSMPSVPSLSSTSVPPPSPSPVSDHALHYLTRSQAGQDRSQHDLVHKSSFGPAGVEGKSLHYLIPDMPMPLKD